MRQPFPSPCTTSRARWGLKATFPLITRLRQALWLIPAVMTLTACGEEVNRGAASPEPEKVQESLAGSAMSDAASDAAEKKSDQTEAPNQGQDEAVKKAQDANDQSAGEVAPREVGENAKKKATHEGGGATSSTSSKKPDAEMVAEVSSRVVASIPEGSKPTEKAPWPVFGSVFLLALLALATVVLVAVVLGRLGRLTKLLNQQSVQLEKLAELVRAGLVSVQRTVGAAAAARNDGGLSEPRRQMFSENASLAPEPHQAEMRGLDPSRHDVEVMLRALVAVAGSSEPVGGVYRLRLETIAQHTGRSVGEVRQVLTRSNTLYSDTEDPVLKRENFLSIMESRSATPGASPYVAALSQEALRALHRVLEPTP